jgi:DNA-binding MarR family transcriptional regulator
MNDKSNDQEAFRTLQLMNELEQDESVSQRELAGRLGVAVGLVNSYLKNLAAKGFLRIKNYPRNRYAYLLTPKGLAEKSRLAYQHLDYFNSLYKTARQDYAKLFVTLAASSVNKVIFCGADEVAEIAFLSLRETNVQIEAVYAESNDGGSFFGRAILPLEALEGWDGCPVIITVSKNREQVISRLNDLDVQSNIYCPGLRPI